jgi:D-arginine dehydrogenase
VRALTGASRAFFEQPPPGFTDQPLMSRRSVLVIARSGEEARLDAFLGGSVGMRRLAPGAAERLLPALRPGHVVAAAVEDDAFDMDVAALHQGFLRAFRSAGGVLALRSRAGGITRADGVWNVEVTGGGRYAAPILINAAGAWGDEVAAQAGVGRLGLTPKRRTACIIDPAPWDVRDWPMVNDVTETWYARPEARTRLLVSPADQTPIHAHDVRPDELDIALGIDRMQQAMDIEVRRVEHAWAGLRTFTPDGSLAIGWDAEAEGFFWCVGQGGYGIQTSPAAGRLVADLIAGRDPEAWMGHAAAQVARMSPHRFGVRQYSA